ncbi:hypothetical protein [Gorillibacterium massiliense]|uniref:hypothetical protein n=1 Tax=Gorillibacterium massiliense TaxID=1280390 RepID=UPI0004B37B0A|nr:hypothetical protein [Gorillibacterium massiliense]
MKKQFLFLFVLFLFISGCKGGNTSHTPSSTTQATPTTTLSSAIPTQTAPRISQKSDAILGEILKDQSFQVNFENLGESEFISTQEKTDGEIRLHFYVKKGDSVAELKYEPSSLNTFFSVSAVSFRDVSGDGKKDIIVIADYATGVGDMGAIPISQLLIFKQTESGFIEDQTIENKAVSGVPYRILTIQDVLIGLKTNPEDSVANAWRRLPTGTYTLDGSDELSGSTLTVAKSSGDVLLFSMDAFYSPDKEALAQGNVNIGTIDPGTATPSKTEMIYKDGDFELTFEMISDKELYLRDNGEPYFGLNVGVTGIYILK